MGEDNKRSEVGDAWWKTTAWKGRSRDVTRRIGKTEREGTYVAKVGENASGKHGATFGHQEDELRQDAECDRTMHHGEGFCNLASVASDVPDANLLVADVVLISLSGCLSVRLCLRLPLKYIMPVFILHLLHTR